MRPEIKVSDVLTVFFSELLVLKTLFFLKYVIEWIKIYQPLLLKCWKIQMFTNKQMVLILSSLLRKDKIQSRSIYIIADLSFQWGEKSRNYQYSVLNKTEQLRSTKWAPSHSFVSVNENICRSFSVDRVIGNWCIYFLDFFYKGNSKVL